MPTPWLPSGVDLILSATEARTLLLATIGPRGLAEDPDSLLEALGMIQLDPLDRIGANADLVAFARTSLGRGRVHEAHSFEHYAKEWCLLPASAFPYYAREAQIRPQWRHSRSMAQLDPGLLDAVEAEVRDRGPLTSSDLSDHGVRSRQRTVWAASSKLGTLALKSLALKCRLVVCGRRNGARVYDVAERVMSGLPAPVESFHRWGLVQRVRSAGMLAVATGPWWGFLKQARKDGTLEQLLDEGRLLRVTVEGSRRAYVIEPSALERTAPEHPTVLLGPLDPMLWNRGLVQTAFDFRYVWEVYKPAAKREWGYYVVPILERGRLVGRLEAHVENGRIVVDQLWGSPDPDALRRALERHQELLAC